MQEFFNNYVQSLETYIMFRIKDAVARLTPELTAKGRAPISLSMGAPTQPPPEMVIKSLQQALSKKGIHTYSSSKGEKFFREACAKRMQTRFGVELNPDTEIHSLIGSKEGIANFIRILINPTTDIEEKEIIMVPDPGYASYKEMVKVSGGIAYSVPLKKDDNYMPDMEKVFDKLKNDGYNPCKVKALLINYPNNPLGATATLDYFKEVVNFCKKHNILLISDAAYTDMYFKPELKPASIFQVDGAKDIAVEFYSFSKPYAMTGWRLGWICGNSEAVGMFAKMKSSLDSGLFKALQEAGAHILNSEEGEEYIKKSNLMFKKNQALFVEGLKELGWKNFNIPDATFYLWLPIPPRYTSSIEFANELLQKSGIVVVPGDGFGEYGKGFFRVSIVCPSEQIPEIFRRMKEDGFYFE
ncbi:MAG: aminotransferase class I/II-fold pyridoxal phosphate-dependent enzyme [bacterium]|nr:aminotransferase class I/II-fold pyridoxal phosphate-dependent enzyme [bacterium]